MMAKRSWEEAHAALSSPLASPTSRRRGYDLLSPGSSSAAAAAMPPAAGGSPWQTSHPSSSSFPSASTPQISGSVPEISRKVKACAACRKQKIRCHMSDGKPPCTRCRQRNLSCVLNKSLQMLMEERTQWHQDILSDLELLHTGVQELREHAALPPLPALRSSIDRPGPDPMDTGGQDLAAERDSGPVSPGGHDSPTVITVVEEGFQVQQMSTPAGMGTGITVPASPFQQSQQPPPRPSLWSADPGENTTPGVQPGAAAAARDFIAAGQVSLADAERLFDLYINKLDFYIYNIGGRWRTLETLRSRSAILTASILTVAALHETGSRQQMYPVCNREFRRLVSTSVFDRRIDRDHLRALSVASYWLSDISWTLSGMAIRRAAEVNLAGNYQRVLSGLDTSEDAADCLRLWYHIYNCDKHLSILYSRQSLAREDLSIMGWEDFLHSTVAVEHDKRLTMQLAMHLILTRINDLFGPDNGIAIPLVYSTQITHYSHELDHWLGVSSSSLRDSSATLGEFPVKAALLYHHFAKLYLFSHVFRGLASTDAVPGPFQAAASGAIAMATSIIEIFLTDPHIGEGLRGMPTYMHAMSCFACIFLLKTAAKRRLDGLVQAPSVHDLATKLVGRFRAAEVSRWHLARLMADGLEKSIPSLLAGAQPPPAPPPPPQASPTAGAAQMGGPGSFASSGPASEGGSVDTARTPFPPYPSDAASISGVHGVVGGGGGGGGATPLSTSSTVQSPDATFGIQGFFDFNAGQT